MSVNMNVFVARCGGRARRRPLVTQEGIDTFEVEPRTEPFEHAAGCQQVTPRGGQVAFGRQGFGVSQPRAGRLVGQVRLLP